MRNERAGDRPHQLRCSLETIVEELMLKTNVVRWEKAVFIPWTQKRRITTRT